MDQSITYKQYRDTIMQSVPHSSYHFSSLVELYSAIDERYTVLQTQLAVMNEITDLRISASLLADAAKLVDDIIVDFSQIVATLGVDETQGNGLYLHNTDRINNIKEIAPEVNDIVYYLSSQVNDFNELFKGYSYSGLDSINPVNITDYMKATKKVSKISSLVYKQVVAKHEHIKSIIDSEIHGYQGETFIMEAADSVKGKYFISLIPDVALIDVGETEEEALERAKDYFDGEIDDTVEVMQCSHGMYNSFTIMGNVPEEWEIVNDVVVLPEEASDYEEINKEDEILENSDDKKWRLMTNKVINEIKCALTKEFTTQHHVKESRSGKKVNILIKPDRFLEDKSFSSKEKVYVSEICDKIKQSDWVDSIKISESKDSIKISAVLNKDSTSQKTLCLNEMVSLNNLPSNNKIFESVEKISESRANGIFQGMTLRIIHHLRESLEAAIARNRLRLGHYRNHNSLMIEIQGDTIFSDGTIPEDAKDDFFRVVAQLSEHPWIDKASVKFHRFDQGLITIRLTDWDNVDMKDAQLLKIYKSI